MENNKQRCIAKYIESLKYQLEHYYEIKFEFNSQTYLIKKIKHDNSYRLSVDNQVYIYTNFEDLFKKVKINGHSLTYAWIEAKDVKVS